MAAELATSRSKPKGIKRLMLALGHSWRGLRGAFKSEAAFRQELALAVFLVPVALWLGKTGIERALMIGALLLVLVVEVLNSSIETVVDRVGFERHELSGLAKDMGSAAVALSLLNVFVVWGLVLFG